MTRRRQPPIKSSGRKRAEGQAPVGQTRRRDEIAVGRELRMISKLEHEVNELCQRSGEAARYPVQRRRATRPIDAVSSAEHPRHDVVPLTSVLCTEELARRPMRPSDYATENAALAILVQALADSPSTILQTLADTIQTTFRADSAGISLLTADGTRFYWPAISGVWQPHIGGGTPREFGPCGDVLDCDGPLLFKRLDRRYTYFASVTPLCEECLLIPFYVKGEAVGTIWTIAHDDRRKFDAEDLRQLESLGRFASAAYQAMESLDSAHEHRRVAHSLMQAAEQSRQAVEALNNELRENEENTRALLDTVPIAVFVCDANARQQRHNAAAVTLCGRVPVGGVEQQVFPTSLVRADGAALLQPGNPLVEVLRTGIPSHSVESVIERPDGTRLSVLANVTPIRNARGETTGAITSCVDITERKQVEEALRRSERQLRDFIENASVGLLWVGLDGLILWANKTEFDMLGYARDEYIGRHIAAFHADQPVIEDMLARFAGGETLVDYPARLRCKDGSIRCVLINSDTLVENGNIVHTRCFTRDVTEQTSAENTLRESEAFNRSIVESSPDCIKVLDLDGNLLSMQRGQALLGIEDIRPFLNRSWLEFWNDDTDRTAAQTALATAVAGGEGNFVGFFRTLRGEPKWWDVRISPILDAHELPARLLAVSRDVTKRRQAEMHSEFLAAISHDLVRLTSIGELMQTIGAKIGAHFDLSLCAFVEIDEAAEQVVINHNWHRADVPSLVGVHGLADFVEGEFIRIARAGEIIVVRDTAADARTSPEKFATLKIASFICVPLIRDRQWRFALCLYRSEAYAWREDEVELARELTVRIWTRLERLRAEDGLRESQRFLRSCLDALSGHIAVLDESGNILEVNEAWRRFADENHLTLSNYGIGSNYVQACEATLPQESEMYAYTAGIADVIAGRQSHFEIEYPCHSPTQERWFVMRVTRFQTPGPVRIVIVHDNISTRRRAEEELRHSEARFRLMADSAPVLIWLSGIDKRCFWFNKTWLDYTGRSMDEEVDNGWTENVHPADRDSCLQAYAAALDARVPLSMEYRLKRHDGEYRWFLDVGVPRYAAEREFSGYIGSCTDITEVRKSEEAMRESEERYHTLFNSIDEGFCIIEALFDEHQQPIDYRFLEINPTFTKQTGLREAVGKRMRELVPEIEEHWIQIYGNVALTGEPIRFVNEAKAMDGRWFDVYACRVGEPDGRKVAIVLNDITARRHSAEALRQTHLALQAHAEELGRFNRIAVGRELRMIELKRETNELCLQRGEPARYPLEFVLGA